MVAVGAAMSRRIVATAFGGPEVLALIDGEVAAPGPGEVLIDVRAAGVNPIDYKLYSGLMGADETKLPMPVGMEVAGVVRAVGPGGAHGPAGAVNEGDEVIAYPISGGYADAVVVNAATVLPKPTSTTWEQAAGLMLTGTTAVHALTATGVSEGETLLVHGAGGGVGLMTVQLAAARGARVIGTARPERHETLRGLGVEPVVYGDGLAQRVRELTPDGIDAAIDAVGTDEAVDVSVELVADRSRIATIAAWQRGAELGIRLLGGAPGAEAGADVRSAARLDLVRSVDSGALEVTVAETYPLEAAAEAMASIAAGHSTGKIVLLTAQV